MFLNRPVVSLPEVVFWPFLVRLIGGSFTQALITLINFVAPIQAHLSILTPISDSKWLL